MSSNREPVAPGVQLDQGRIATSAGSQAVNIVEVDLSNPVISLESSLSNERVADLERTSTQAQNHSYEGHRVVAAINGDVWAGFSNDMEDAPNGLHVEAGELVTSGTAGRPTFGVGADGRPVIGSPLVAVTLTTSVAGQFVINRVNQLRRAGEVVLYTPHFGPRTSSAASGIDIILSGLALPLRASGAWTATVSGIRPAEGGGPIDPGTIILTAPATSPLAALVPGEQVTLTTAVSAGWESVLHAVGGREWIVRDGNVSISPRPASADEIHPRSSIGLTADGRVIMATVDGRQSGWSAGMQPARPGRADAVARRGHRPQPRWRRLHLAGRAARRDEWAGPHQSPVRRVGAGGHQQHPGRQPRADRPAVRPQRPAGGAEPSTATPPSTSGSAAWTGPTTRCRCCRARPAWSVSAPIGTIDAERPFRRHPARDGAR